MKKNLGSADRIIRLSIGVIAAVLFFTDVVTGTAGIVMLVAGAVLALTSLISFCPLYALVGLNSCPVKK